MNRANTFKAAALLLLAAVAAFTAVWRAGAAAAAQQNPNQNTSGNQNTAAQPPAGRPPAGQPAGPQQGGPLADLLESIKGKEELPAEQVFKNIKQLKGVPAGRVLRAMGSFTRALGVNCAHCHVPREWEKDDKPTKEIARGMIRMVTAINTEQLKSIPNLRPEASVSCSTCHRGSTRPDPRLPGAGGPPGQQQPPPPGGNRPAGAPTPTPSPGR
jgi:hypothetical protein